MTLPRLMALLHLRQRATVSPETPSSDPATLSLQPARYRMGPLGTWMHARAFKVAAEKLRTEEGQMPAVVAFLYCRALELALKAYLLARGRPGEAVKGFGH